MIQAVEHPRRSRMECLRARSHVVKHARICVSDEPRQLVYPGIVAEPKLKVEKENGIVRGFSYRCSCGRTDHFKCE